MATSGDLLLATSGDFYMATDTQAPLCYVSWFALLVDMLHGNEQGGGLVVHRSEAGQDLEQASAQGRG